MARLTRSLDPMNAFHHGRQTTNKFLSRVPMNDRLYHMNYNTYKHKEGSVSKLSGVDPKEK
jgi:hypothetical protein